MVKIENQVFLTSVNLDGKWFHQCRFEGCNLIYNGGPVRLTECSFDNPHLMLGGFAQTTIATLKQMGFVISLPGLWEKGTLQ
jgi:hypothetical protein